MIFRLLTAIFSIALLLSCDHPATEQEISVAHLKSLCRGDHYRITDDYIVRGVVVATDWLGEMNKSAVIVDDSGGLEFAIDLHNISSRLPIYSEVSIFCNGLFLARIGSKITLGAAPTGDFPLDNINDEMIDRYIRVEGSREMVSISTKRFCDIVASDISNLVRFDNVRIVEAEEGLPWCDTVDGEIVTTYRTLIDHEGNTFALRTLSSCHYATEAMPQNEISVVGIVDYADDRYFLRIVNKGIIQ